MGGCVYFEGTPNLPDAAIDALIAAIGHTPPPYLGPPNPLRGFRNTSSHVPHWLTAGA